MQGPKGSKGSTGSAGPPGPPGPAGPAAKSVAKAHGGLFNLEEGEFEIKPDEIVAMTFSDFLPADGMWYDDHHSMVLGEHGVYEIYFSLRACSMTCGRLYIAITNDGVVIPSSRISCEICPDADCYLSGVAVTKASAGAHLHFIVFAKQFAKIKLHEGANLMMHVKKLAD